MPREIETGYGEVDPEILDDIEDVANEHFVDAYEEGGLEGIKAFLGGVAASLELLAEEEKWDKLKKAFKVLYPAIKKINEGIL